MFGISTSQVYFFFALAYAMLAANSVVEQASMPTLIYSALSVGHLILAYIKGKADL